ncbi:hypothetical protein [Mariniblastus fucicola]|uniref:Uncharacterized protein n=1 Tax=Mariniblastus fucicola TaxID=980251 RepID=A0A5B9P964_9BACT|nr:hypothetical protein [Mariniblastus fucicola]QEG23287.1 hypothetical protein MFFC18_31830 [Mariniblastus fucicola]
MRNRIAHLLESKISTAQLCQRPKLTLTVDRPVKVDMERFFDFSFSFAEALMELEDKHRPEQPVVSLERELALKASIGTQHDERDLDIDARWM